MDSTVPRAQAVVEAARAVGRKNLTWGTAGNISVRIGENQFLVSASGVGLADLRVNDLARCSLDGSVREGSPRPSVETPLHREIYRARSDVEAILHASPFYATLVASSEIQPDPALTTDTAFYVRRIRRVPFYPPSSEELARAAAGQARDADALLLDNHGAVTVGLTPADTVTSMEALEMLCHMCLYGALGAALRPLGAADVDSIMRRLAGHAAI